MEVVIMSGLFLHDYRLSEGYFHCVLSKDSADRAHPSLIHRLLVSGSVSTS